MRDSPEASTRVYIDTSALAKWYVPEVGSDDFEAWLHQASTPTISSLTLVEMRCLLARRRRNDDIDRGTERRAFELFREHVDARLLAVEPVNDADVRSAVNLMARVDSYSLRTLDAIHLSICTSREIGQLATADAVLAGAAAELGIEVVRFD